MSKTRLSLALELGAVSLPETGTIALFCEQHLDVGGLPREYPLHVVSPWWPLLVELTSSGLRAGPEAPESAGAAIVVLPRSRDGARAMLGAASQTVGEGGLVLVDGQKTDGVDSFLREIRDRVPVIDSFVKFHGRLFWFRAEPVAFSDWESLHQTWPLADGFHTSPGVFSADGPDPASVALARALPERLAPRIADLGAGWGYLSAQVLKRAGVRHVDLVEAHHGALDAARKNLADPRARFHWADATSWTTDTPVDAVVLNPPFHTGRMAEPALGQAFIKTAARVLKPDGALWLVANRQLPYEALIETLFSTHRFLDAPAGFKIIVAEHPRKGRQIQRGNKQGQGLYQ